MVLSFAGFEVEDDMKQAGELLQQSKKCDIYIWLRCLNSSYHSKAVELFSSHASQVCFLKYHFRDADQLGQLHRVTQAGDRLAELALCLGDLTTLPAIHHAIGVTDS